MDGVWTGSMILAGRPEALGSPGTATGVPGAGGVGEAGGRGGGVDDVEGEGGGGVYDDVDGEGGGGGEEIEDGGGDMIVDNTGCELGCVCCVEAVKVVSVLG